MSSFYEAENENDSFGAESTTGPTSSQPLPTPTSLFASNDEPKNNEKKSKSKNKYNIGGARIVTLNNMSSSEEEDDETSGQVCLCCEINYNYDFNITFFLLGILCWRL